MISWVRYSPLVRRRTWWNMRAQCVVPNNLVRSPILLSRGAKGGIIFSGGPDLVGADNRSSSAMRSPSPFKICIELELPCDDR